MHETRDRVRAQRRSDPETRKQLFALQAQVTPDAPHRFDRQTERGLTRTLKRYLAGRWDGVAKR